MKKPLVIVVTGPTASGKTSLSIELAKRLNGEIVSADSMQIYRDMDIATAKPDVEEMQGIPHHLIGFVPIGENFSVARFKASALKVIADIVKRGKQPIVVGGTGLYIDTLINNTEFIEYRKSSVRQELEKRFKEEGIQPLFRELERIDPITAHRLHINDTKRIIRALELFYTTGKTITIQRQFSHIHESEYDWCLIGINAENRQILYDRINKRVDVMIEKGLLNEAKSFFKRKSSKTAKQAIGYKELKPHLDGKITLDEALYKLKTETRHYAKRQLTWFRRNDAINWIYIDKLTEEELVLHALEIVNGYRS